MRCAWNAVLEILPLWMLENVDRLGKDSLQELRLRVGETPELVMGNNSLWLSRRISAEDIIYCINKATQYSPWSSATISHGYLTIAGGHRIGLCGETVCRNGIIDGMSKITSICIRIARDFHHISLNPNSITGSILVIGPPGWGKTTILRDLAREKASLETVAVIDEREELFPAGFLRGKRMDVLTCAPKGQGIDMLVRTMGPKWIAVDEITAEEDCSAILRAHGCGVQFIASAHAGTKQELMQRPVYKELIRQEVFRYLLIMQQDKSFREERMPQWSLNGSVRY